VNLPVGSQPAAIFLPEDEFEQNYGFEKPAADKELVFYCRAGIRSNTAAQLARQQGYTNVAEYKGSWLDWEKNGGPTAQP
jgi:rhodanese-related sulfurtransferase